MNTPYKVQGDVTVFYIIRKSGEEFETKISTKDLGKVLSTFSCLCVSRQDGPGGWRVCGRIIGQNKVRLLHRILMNASEGEQVDHVDTNPLNNCRENLRLATNQQNCQNRARAYSNSKSGIRGVWWNKRNRNWNAGIKVNYKYKHVGCFATKEEAEAAVKRARAATMPFSKEGMEAAANKKESMAA